MNLLTDDLRAQLLANGRNRDADPMPVVKFFNPLGAGVWLATELDADGDTLFGLCRVQHNPNYVEQKIMLGGQSGSQLFRLPGRIASHNYNYVLLAVASIASSRSDTPVNVPFLMSGGAPASRMSSFSAGSIRK